MNDRVTIYDRCIAMQLQREPTSRPPLPPPHTPLQSPLQRQDPSQQQQRTTNRFFPFHYGSLHRKQSENCKRKEEESVPASPQKGSADATSSQLHQQQMVSPDQSAPPSADTSQSSCKTKSNSPKTSTANNNSSSTLKIISSPLSSNSSGTPTPTNGASPSIMNNISNNHQVSNLNSYDMKSCNSFQEGFQLYHCWVATNAECVWDEELVRAVCATHFLGFLVGGFILIGGTPRVMAAIIHAHSRALLNAPPGWMIIVLGELRECEVSVVQRGQFTPLGDALCWTIHRLSKRGVVTDQKEIHNSLLTHFPSMAPPEPALIHAALTDLIRQRKVFHTGRGYGIVKADTYLPEPAPPATPRGKDSPNPPPRLLTTSEALTKAHGTAETETDGDVTHTAVQTDLADLLAGIWPQSSILIARPSPSPLLFLQRSGSFRGEKQSLTSILNERERLSWQAKYQLYQADDTSDISVKGAEKGSVFSKILRVSQPRRRLASFSAQFPPPEWTDPTASSKHLHSIATQTRSPRHPGGPETCWMPATQWAPRSSTLPRRPSKPASSSSPVPIDVHFRPHSTSPSPLKMPYNKAYIHSQPGSVAQQHASSSSTSPCVTSAHSSRTTSPSLQSTTATHHENRMRGHNSRSLSPFKGTSPKHKSSSPSNKQRKNHSSVSHPNSPLHVNQQSPMRKPPPTSSPHHIASKDYKRKELSFSSHESSLMVESTTSRKEKRSDNPGVKHPSPIRAKVRVKNSQESPQREIISDSSPGKMKQSKPEELEEETIGHHRNKKVEKTHEDASKSRKHERSSLQLDLTSEVHMNNFRKIVASPQKPEGLKNNVFHENLSSIAKGSVSDLTSKNMGYRDINKCDKKLYADETQKPDAEKEPNSTDLNDEAEEQTKPEETRSIPAEEKRKMKLSLPLKDSSILAEGNMKKLEKKLHRKSLISLDNKNESKNKDKIILSPLEDLQSVKTYPSLSDLNLTFSSLTAQKILQGVSVNSIDTLVEVNMLAEKRKLPSKGDVTNTDFGFV